MTIPYDSRWEDEYVLAMGFDQYQRYRLMAELLAALKQSAAQAEERWQVLDIGGFDRRPTGEPWLPMLSFAPQDEVTVVDTVPCDLPQYRQASGTDLPFSDSAFEVVVSCDTLEHVPQDGRAAFLRELCRVARRAVIVAAPHATAGVSYAERALDEYLRSFGMVHPMLDEHLRYGIPEPAWVESWLAQQELSFVSFPSGYLRRWLPMMLLRHQLVPISATTELYQRLEQTYNERFYERDQRAPGYRQVYFISLEGAVPAALQPFVERAARPEPEDPAADLLGIAVAPLTRALTQLLQLQENYNQLEQHFRGLEEHYYRLAEGHATLATAHDEALRRAHETAVHAAALEGEKRGLQQQLEMLRWQNEALQARLGAGSPLRALRALLASVLGLARRR